MPHNFKGWILCDQGKIGTLRQCEALAEILQKNCSISFEMSPIILPKFFQFLPVWFGKLLWPSFFSKKLQQPYPNIIIVAGRRSIMAFLSMNFNGYSIAILNPRVSISNFDLVIAPKHDQLTGQNVITIDGSLHGIRPSLFKQESNTKQFVAVMIGGDTKYYKYTQNDAERIAYYALAVRNLVDPTAKICITASRRTPQHIISIVKDILKECDFEFWDGEGENPYQRYITQSQAILVTNDSISMMSEVCITGKPVYVYEMPIKNQKFVAFLQGMIANRHCSKVEQWQDSNWFVALDEYQKVQAQILKLIPAKFKN